MEDTECSSGTYAAFLGAGAYGQLTAKGVAQCQSVGRELRRRYPTARISVCSTNFPRTIDSAKAVLSGFDADNDVQIIVRCFAKENLLPNFDGSCSRYTQLR